MRQAVALDFRVRQSRGLGAVGSGQLNRSGYAVAFAVVCGFHFSPPKGFGIWPGQKDFRAAQKFLRRFRRPLPFCFAALAVLIFLGGAIHPPGNYTGLAYRAGRVLQWLSHGHWFWIDTEDYRMNDRACGIEWLSAPLLLFTNSTRGLFLVNFLPFLLLPGLGVQRLHATRRPRAGGVALDVAAADRLQFHSPGRRQRE